MQALRFAALVALVALGTACPRAPLGAVEQGQLFGSFLFALVFVRGVAGLLRRVWKSAAGPAFMAGLVCSVLHASCSSARQPPLPLSEWDPAMFVLASTTWWLVFRRRDTRAAQRAPTS